jgi:hypothetical protein
MMVWSSRPSISLTGCLGMVDVICLRGSKLKGRWDDEAATGLLRAALAEIDALGHELSSARAEALLNEFERDVGSAFLCQDLFAVKVTCEGYQHRFRTLARKAKCHRHSAGRRTAPSLRTARRLIRIGQRKATERM